MFTPVNGIDRNSKYCLGSKRGGPASLSHTHGVPFPFSHLGLPGLRGISTPKNAQLPSK